MSFLLITWFGTYKTWETNCHTITHPSPAASAGVLLRATETKNHDTFGSVCLGRTIAMHVSSSICTECVKKLAHLIFLPIFQKWLGISTQNFARLFSVSIYIYMPNKIWLTSATAVLRNCQKNWGYFFAALCRSLFIAVQYTVDWCHYYINHCVFQVHHLLIKELLTGLSFYCNVYFLLLHMKPVLQYNKIQGGAK